MKLAYLGPTGTFTEQAALKIDPKAVRIPRNTIPDVFKAVKAGKAHAGVVAVENMLGGMIRETLDELYRSELKVIGETLIPIHHCLAVFPGAKKIDEIVGHSQAIAQCRKFLKRTFPKARLREYASNTLGMQEIALGKLHTVAAVGPEIAARKYGLKVRSRNIEDSRDNITRFWLIGKKIKPKRTDDKVSLAYHFKRDRPGGLYQSLGCFSREGINLTRLSVLPSAEKLGNYIFHVDIEANLSEERARFALAGLRRIADTVKVLGSYMGARP